MGGARLVTGSVVGAGPGPAAVAVRPWGGDGPILDTRRPPSGAALPRAPDGVGQFGVRQRPLVAGRGPEGAGDLVVLHARVSVAGQQLVLASPA
ncbi:MAG: hypothetical protein ACK55I_04975, partial [bacterium]